jgi:hypothetical protein
LNDGNQTQKISTEGSGSPIMAAGRDLIFNYHSYAEAELTVPTLSKEAQSLIVKASETESARIIFLLEDEEPRVGVSGFSFPVENTSRGRPRWKRVNRELAASGFVDDVTGDGELFELNDAGFQLADQLIGTIDS